MTQTVATEDKKYRCAQDNAVCSKSSGKFFKTWGLKNTFTNVNKISAYLVSKLKV